MSRRSPSSSSAGYKVPPFPRSIAMASKKTAAKKTAKKTAAKKTAKTAAKKTAKTAAKKTAKTAAKKTAAKKTPAKKAAAKKTSMKPAPALEMKTWNGSCHCGNVRFTLESDLSGAMTCNCSICQRAGHVLTFVGTDKFTLLSGADEQTDYQFNKKHIHHLFCKTCGVRSFGWGNGPDGSKMYSVNIRCLEGVNLADVPTTQYDGASS
ncbi:MAG TPA: GFA family protein [Myxococcota bacterium]